MLLNDADRRDLLFLATERQAAAYNRRRAYFPSSRDVARAYVNSKRRLSLTALPVVLAVVALAGLSWSMGWLGR